LINQAQSLSNVDYFFFPHTPDIIPKDFLEKYNCIGFHTGDLPDDRGGSPIQHKILKGEYVTNVSALKLSENIDGGEIYSQRKIDLSFGNIETIVQDISNIVAELIIEIIMENPTPIKQKPGGFILKRLTENDSRFSLEELSPRQIYDRIRMLDGLDYPKANVVIGTHTITLSEAVYDNYEISFKCSIRLGDDNAKHL
jgi:methionyl-tRNA formyltransferase